MRGYLIFRFLTFRVTAKVQRLRLVEKMTIEIYAGAAFKSLHKKKASNENNIIFFTSD